MSAALFTLPFPVAFTSRGVGAPRAKVYFYQTGTLTALPVYTTSALTTQASNPSTADGAGRFDAIYLDNTKTYRVVINDKTGAQLCDVDPYIPGQAPDAGSLQPYADAAAASASSSSGSATASAASAAAGIISQAAALLSANNAAVSEGNAGNSATTAGNASTSAASILSSILLALAGTSLGTATLAASSRTAMASLSHSAGIPAYLSEGVRAGMFLPMSAAVYNATTGRTLTADVAIDTGNNIIVPYSGDSTGASGAWVYPYWSQDVPARLFGATDGTDVKTAIEAWATVIWQIPCASASCRVKGTSSLPIVVGTSSGSQTKLIRFGPTINATATMDALVTMQHPGAAHIDFAGSSLFGSVQSTAPASLGNRNASVGIVLTDAQYMTSAGRLGLTNFYHWGLAINDSIAVNGNNSNFAQLPQLVPTACGVSVKTGGTSSLSANWSTPVRSGATVNATQTTTIIVDVIPRTDNVIGEGWIAWINGSPYRVASTASSGNPTYPYLLTLSCPWLEDAMMTAGSGTLGYTMGGKAAIKGADSGVIRILGIGGSKAGISLLDATAYGVIVDRLENNSGEDVWLAYGRPVNTFHYATKIITGYIEGTGALAHVISLAATGSARCSIGRVSGADLDFSKFFKLGPRSNTGGDNNLLFDQLMDELIHVQGYEGKCIVAQYGCDFATTWDPPSCANGTPVSTTISIPASFGYSQSMRVKLGTDLSGLALSAYISSTSAVTKTTVTVQLSNPNAATPVDLPSTTATVSLLQ